MDYYDEDRLRSFILQHLADNLQCASCHRNYDPDELEIVGHRDGVWFVRVGCDFCGTEGVVMVMLQTREGGPAGLTSSQLRREDPGPITVEEVNAVHDLLSRYRGNLSELAGTR